MGADALGPYHGRAVRHYPVVSEDPEDDQGGGTGELGEGQRWRTRGG
jgi:hypothetical protein